MTAVTVVTPWLNCPELAHGYWQAVEAGADVGDRVVIVDNGSSPPLEHVYRERTGRQPSGWVTFDRQHSNLGFARACNRGLDLARTDAVLFLNNDIRLRDPGWLTAIRRELRDNVLVGAQLRTDPHTQVDGQPVPYLDGWCVAGMTRDLRALGGWDDELEEPSYWGDNLLSVRAKQAGMRLVQADVGLRHLGNYTSRRMNVDGVSARNRERYEQAVRTMRGDPCPSR